MTFISITTIRACREGTRSSFLIPIVPRNIIEERIDSFIRERTNLCRIFSAENSPLIVRELFQNCERELFFFPNEEGRGASYPLPAGELLLGHLSNSNSGIVLYFFPHSERYLLRYVPTDRRQNLKFFLRENDSDKVESFSFSKSYISCLSLESGSIITHTNGFFTLAGIKIEMILSSHCSSTLTCKKLESDLTVLTVPMHPIKISTSDTASYNNFVKVLCSSRIENFCCVLKFPVLTEKELQLKLSQSYAIRAKKFLLLNSDQHLYTSEKCLFLSHSNELICFPRGMGLNLLLRHACGGSLLFSYDKNNNFKCVIISYLFKSRLTNLPHRNLIFPDWQAKKNSFFQRNLSTTKMFIFSSKEMQLVKEEGSNEYVITGGHLKLISTCRSGFWGCFLSKAQPFPSQASICDSQAVLYQCSMNLLPSFFNVQAHGKRRSTSSNVQTHGKKRSIFSCESMNLPYTQSFPSVSYPQPNSSLPSIMSSAQLTGSYEPFPSHTSTSWWDPQADPSQGPIGMPSQPTGSYEPFPSHTSTSWWDPQADPSQGPIGMPSQPTGSYEPFPSHTSTSWWDPQADPSQGPIGMPSQPTGSYEPFPSHTSTSWWDPQADPSQGPIGMPSQPTGSYEPFPSHTSTSWWDPQADPSQGPIGMPSQPTGSYEPFPSHTSTSWWDPQADPSQGPIGMPSQPTGSYEPFPSHTSTSWWDPQADPSQGPIGMPSQPTGSYEPFPSQTSTSWWDPQADPSQGPIEMPSAQPTSSYGQTSWMTANPQAADPSRKEGLTLQGAMGSRASEKNKLKDFTLQDFLPLDQLQYILGEEKNDDYSQSEND